MRVKKFNRVLAVGAFLMTTMSSGGMPECMKQSMGQMRMSPSAQMMKGEISMKSGMFMGREDMGIQMMRMESAM